MKYARRNALKALAAIPFAAPLARAFASPGAPPPSRLVILMQNNGTQQANFWPDAAMRSPILDALFRDESGTPNGLAAKANVIKGRTISTGRSATSTTSGSRACSRARS